MLSISNSYAVTFDYEYANVNDRILTNINSVTIDFANNKFIALSPPYYYLAMRTNGFYLSQYNYFLNQEGWVTNWGSGKLYSVIITPDSSRLFASGIIRNNYDGQTNSGIQNTYVARINATNGTIEWSRIFGSTGTDYPKSIALDSNTNVFILSMADGSVGTNVNKGCWDLLLAKYSYNGNCLWTKMWGGTSNDVGRNIAVDRSNNVYLLGDTQGNIGTNVNSGGCDMFLIKTDNDGNTLWTKMIGSNLNDYSSSVEVDCSNNVIIYGYTGFGSFYTIGNAALIKLDSSGSNIWTKSLGTNYFHYVGDDLRYSTGEGIALDRDNIYISGITASSNSSVTLTKFTNDGSNLWTKTWAAGTNYFNFSLSKDTLDNIIIVSQNQNIRLDFHIITIFPKYDLIINGSPDQHGTNSLYLIYGTNRVVARTTFTNSISDEYPVTGTRYLCTGWTNGTGSIALSGLTNTVAFFLTNNSTLTWNWQKQYYVAVSNIPSGCEVNYASGTNGWNNDGTRLELIASPQVYFQPWSIDYGIYTETFPTNPWTLLSLTCPISVTANFGYHDSYGYGFADEWIVKYEGKTYWPTGTKIGRAHV